MLTKAVFVVAEARPMRVLSTPGQEQKAKGLESEYSQELRQLVSRTRSE